MTGGLVGKLHAHREMVLNVVRLLACVSSGIGPAGPDRIRSGSVGSVFRLTWIVKACVYFMHRSRDASADMLAGL